MGQPWAEEEKDYFDEVVSSCQGPNCNVEMAEKMNDQFSYSEEQFTALHCHLHCRQMLKKRVETQERKRFKQLSKSHASLNHYPDGSPRASPTNRQQPPTTAATPGGGTPASS